MQHMIAQQGTGLSTELLDQRMRRVQQRWYMEQCVHAHRTPLVQKLRLVLESSAHVSQQTPARQP